MIEALKELSSIINVFKLDLKISSEHLAKLIRFPIFEKLD